MADFASMLKYFREREGLSQRDLAEKLGISKSTISMYEMGKRHPKFEDEEAIADFFNVDLNTLRGKRISENSVEDEARARAIVKMYAEFSQEELDDEEMREKVLKAFELYVDYEKASLESRSMVDFALKRSQQKP